MEKQTKIERFKRAVENGAFNMEEELTKIDKRSRKSQLL